MVDNRIYTITALLLVLSGIGISTIDFDNNIQVSFPNYNQVAMMFESSNFSNLNDLSRVQLHSLNKSKILVTNEDIVDWSVYEDLSDWEINELCIKRGTYLKHDWQLEHLYNTKKEQLLTKNMSAEEYADELDTFATIVIEKNIRLDNNTFFRDPIGTTYYIDCDNGDDGNTGTATGDAWKTIAQYTTTTVRTPGDIAYVRAGTTCNYTASFNFDEDGNISDTISIIGAITPDDDVWSDGSAVMPQLQGIGNVYPSMNSDEYWYFKNLRFNSTQCTSTFACAIYLNSANPIFENCEFYHIANVGIDIRLLGVTYFKFINSRFEVSSPHSFANAIYFGSISNIGEFDNCTINSINYGVQFSQSANYATIRNSVINATSHSVYIQNGGANINIYNSNISSIFSDKPNNYVFLENSYLDGTFYTDYFFEKYMQYVKYDESREGSSANYSIGLEHTASYTVGLFMPQKYSMDTWSYYLEPGTYNISLYLKLNNSGIDYSSSYMFLQTSYLSDGYHRDIITSTETVFDDGAWHPISTLITQDTAGWVNLELFIRRRANTEVILLDPEVNIDEI